MAAYNPYSSAIPFFAEAAPSGIPELDAARLRSYAVYEQMYWNHPETFKLLQRGEDEAPIYVPAARKIIEATHRFLAVDFDFVVAQGTGDDGTLDTFLRALFKRELFQVKVNAQKRFGLIRGDAIWHITADDTKPEGTRISLHDVDPSRYFPIFDPDNDERILGCHLIDTVVDPKDENKQLVRRQTYRKTDGGGISSELSLWEVGKWDDRFLKPADLESRGLVRPTFDLPPAITALPVYHIRNTWQGGVPFGSSTIRGVETLIAAANQGTSDQALAMAMAGLGGYFTDASPPIDPATQLPTAWEIGPMRMTEVPQGRTVGRLQGVGSVEPSLNHINFVLDQAQTGAGVPDIAAGKVDVSVAESGISLRLQLAPILAANAERERTLIGVYDQMFFDLTRMWMAAYESFTTEAEVGTIVGDPLPSNRVETINEIVALVGAKLLSVEEGRTKLIALGYEIEASSAGLIAEQAALAAATDTFGARVNEELENAEPGRAPIEA